MGYHQEDDDHDDNENDENDENENSCHETRQDDQDGGPKGEGGVGEEEKCDEDGDGATTAAAAAAALVHRRNQRRQQQRQSQQEQQQHQQQRVRAAGSNREHFLDSLGPPYARRVQYWKSVFFSTVPQGALMACVALAFFNAYVALSRATWLSRTYREALENGGGASGNTGDNNTNSNYDEIQIAWAVSKLFPNFLNFTEDHNDDSASTSTTVLQPLQLGHGEWWYVALLAAGGWAVGCIKVVWNLLMSDGSRERDRFPRDASDLPGMVVDVRVLRGHSAYLPWPVLLCSAVSIGAGASVGPEMPLGMAGTALGSLAFARRFRVGPVEAFRYNDNANAPNNDTTTNKVEDDDDAVVEVHENPNNNSSSSNGTNPKEDGFAVSFVRHVLPDLSDEPELCALDGITGAFGALFSSQLLAVLLVLELSHGVWKNTTTHGGSRRQAGGGGGGGGCAAFRYSFMEIMSRTAISSSIAYTVFTTLEDRTLLQQMAVPFAVESLLPTIDPAQMLIGLVLGILSGIVGFIGVVCMGIFAKLGTKVQNTLDAIGERMFGLNPKNPRGISLGMLFTPAIGGALVGLLCKAAPLLLGSGDDQMSRIIFSGNELGLSTVVASGFLKLVTLSISLGFGFVGGQIFPLFFTGTCMGVVAHMLLPDLVPIAVSVPCCLIAVPCAFTPLIMTLTIFASLTFALGGAATSPVFLAGAISYTTISGFGIIQKQLERSMSAKAKEAAANATNPENEDISKRQQQHSINDASMGI